jgi:hypothetical protein
MAMTRRCWLRWFAGLVSVAVFAVSNRQAGGDEKKADLNETLRSVLKCRRAEEFAFVESVANKVNQGDLPKDMVLSMMKWATERRPEFPFPYFKEGIKLRAAKIGVQL